MESNKKIIVAQIIGTSSSGGVPSFVMNYFRNIDRNKINFIFYTYGPSPLDDEIISLGGKIVFMPDVRNFFKCVTFLKNSFLEKKVEIVHSHMTTLSVTPLFAAKLAHIAYRICHAHSTTHKMEKTYLIKSFLKPFATIFSTHLAGCSHLSMLWLYGKKQGSMATLIPNAIDLSKFSPNQGQRNELLSSMGLKDNFVIGNIGRFEYQKNHSFLVDAFEKTLLLIPNAILILVGKGKKEKTLKDTILKKNLSDKVLFLPEIIDVNKYYSLFDVFWLPSLYEGLPLVAIEAQAMDIPCILSSKITKETDISCKSIFLDINDPSLWARATYELMLNAPKSQDNYNLLKCKGYDIADAAKTLLDYYTSLISK